MYAFPTLLKALTSFASGISFCNLSMNDSLAKPVIEQFRKDNPSLFADVETVADHIDRVVQLAGIDHVGIGSDLDGGLGLEESPVEIDTVADLSKVGLVVPVEVREAVLSTNWLNFLRSSLPKTSKTSP